MTAPADVHAFRAMTVADLDRVVAIEVGAYGHPWSRANFVDSLAAGHDARVMTDGQGQPIGYSIVRHGVDEHPLLKPAPRARPPAAAGGDRSGAFRGGR